MSKLHFRYVAMNAGKICAGARKPAMNLRIGAQGRRVQRGEQVDIGGKERDRAVCPNCLYSDHSSGSLAPGLFG